MTGELSCGGLWAAASDFARYQSWGVGPISLEHRHEFRHSTAWVDSDTLLYTSNASIPPTELAESCTVGSEADGRGCEWRNGSRVCVQVTVARGGVGFDVPGPRATPCAVLCRSAWRFAARVH